MAGLAGFALTIGGFEAAFTAFVVAAVVLVALLFGAAFTVAGAEEATVRRIKVQGPVVRRWGGWIMVGVGAWFLLLAAFADFFERAFPV